MILVDTSDCINWLIGSPTGKGVAYQFPEQADWLVPTMVQLELSKWLTREVGQDKADQVMAFTRTCTVMPLDTGIALAAADACRRRKLATAAAVIFATAQAAQRPATGRRGWENRDAATAGKGVHALIASPGRLLQPSASAGG